VFNALQSLSTDGRLLFATRFVGLFADGAQSVVLVPHLFSLGLAGLLKIAYDRLLFRAFRALKAPEEVARTGGIVLLVLAAAPSALAQNGPPTLRAGSLTTKIVIDGQLTETAWESADAIEDFRQTDPAEGAASSEHTRVQVLADRHSIVIGVVCDVPDPTQIVSFSVQRDAILDSEDHIRVVLGPFADGRSGYVFAVNPTGARYDGLINPGGEDVNADWDGIWEAATAKLPTGWSAEIRIPIMTLAFKPGLHEWHFNVQRRIQRRLETDRWASPNRQYQITQTSQAGLLTGLPDFDLGAGLTIRPAITSGGGVPAPDTSVEGDFQPSLDINQRIGANVLASGTVNTDFAETEVDTRRTNLTRFPLFFPEKRTFFIEGDDIFSFGLGLGRGRDSVLQPPHRPDRRTRSADSCRRQSERPRREHQFWWRRCRDSRETRGCRRRHIHGRRASEAQPVAGVVGLGRSRPVGDPLRASWKLARRRGLYVRHLSISWRQELPRSAHGAWRPAERIWERNATAAGFKVDYPNDLVDMALTYKRIGPDFDPSIGFVPRANVQLWKRGRGLQPTVRARSDPADVLRIRTVAGDGSVGSMGELSGVLGAGELAVPQRRSVRVQRGPRRRAADGSLRDRDGRLHPARVVRVDAVSARGGHSEEAAVLYTSHVVVWRLLQRHAGSVSMDRRLEPEADRHG
jgi:hypothetical protein